MIMGYFQPMEGSMKLKQFVSAAMAAALLCAGVAVSPVNAAGAIKKEVIWYDADYFEVGRTYHYCDGTFGADGSPELGVFQSVTYYSCN